MFRSSALLAGFLESGFSYLRREEMTKRVLLTLGLALSLLGLGKTGAFAQSPSDLIVQKGLDAQKMGKYGKAYQWFRIAAEAGNVDGEYHAGYCCLAGEGVRLDEEQAVKWFQKAVDQGDERSEFFLGSCYENGWGVNLKLEEAKRWYQTSLDHGFKGAENALKRLAAISASQAEKKVPVFNNPLPLDESAQAAAWVSQGIADEEKQDYSSAVLLFRKAADAGNTAGEAQLGTHYLMGLGVTKDVNLGIQWTRKSADAGNALAQTAMAGLYRKGLGVDRDYHAEFNWYKKAADQGDPKGEFYLGACYQQGEGVDKNLNEAKKFFQKSADQGYVPAQKSLSYMEKGIPIVVIN
jgi:uncharacterized protein